MWSRPWSRPVWESIALEHPEHLNARSMLGATLNNLGLALAKLGRSEDDDDAYREAIALQRAALDKAPEVAQFRLFLTHHYANLAEVQRTRGRPAEAAASAPEWQQLWPTDPGQLFGAARALSRCAPLVARDQAVPTQGGEAERRRYADMAMRALRQAVSCGEGDLAPFQWEPALEPLRSCADFKAMMMDLAVPADPFARSH
jgi:hypothetical protein